MFEVVDTVEALVEEVSRGGGVADTGLDFIVVFHDGVEDGSKVNASLVDTDKVLVDKGA